ncbi:MAG: sigma-70 family RNA polymerase sigma factor [Prolixibacteraceae bacterium]|nr:sigma-70 family RNA polymerase sigma factor [Prolixibacteraceae bacterium]
MKIINWDELYRRNAPILIGLCRRYTGDEALARDLVQDTFITAFEKIADYKGKGSIESWIRKIAVNKALMYLRNHKVHMASTEMFAQAVEVEIDMENPSLNKRRAIEEASFSTNELLDVIDALPQHHKAVFNLYVIDGYKHQQIAGMLDISSGTSKSHLARARKKAQELLYERALEKKPDEKKQKRMIFFLLLLPNRIDVIFRRGFRSFEIPMGSISSAILPLTESFIQQSLSLTGKLFISVAGVSLVGMGIFLASLHLSNSKPDNFPEPVVVADTMQVQADSLSIPSDNNSMLVKPTATSPFDQSTIVVVKKQVIIHDTICLEKPH